MYWSNMHTAHCIIFLICIAISATIYRVSSRIFWDGSTSFTPVYWYDVLDSESNVSWAFLFLLLLSLGWGGGRKLWCFGEIPSPNLSIRWSHDVARIFRGNYTWWIGFKVVTKAMAKKNFSGPPSPKSAPTPIFFLIRSKVTKYMPKAKKTWRYPLYCITSLTV